jgi:hypothetical protein
MQLQLDKQGILPSYLVLLASRYVLDGLNFYLLELPFVVPFLIEMVQTEDDNKDTLEGHSVQQCPLFAGMQ